MGYSYLSASIGSSRAARQAGYDPKNTPMPPLIPIPRKIEGMLTAAGKDQAAPARSARPTPLAMPIRPPLNDSVVASTELGEDVAPACAERFADADLAGALGHGHQHDVHDDDAAHDQRDRGHSIVDEDPPVRLR
jgi:hypothetical protein